MKRAIVAALPLLWILTYSTPNEPHTVIDGLSSRFACSALGHKRTAGFPAGTAWFTCRREPGDSQ